MRFIAGIFALSWCAFADGPATNNVLNSASYQAKLAPGTWAAIFGTQLAPSLVVAPSTPFPTQLGGVFVTVAGKAAPLSFVSPGQINALIPFDAATLTGTQTTQVPVVVTSPGGASAAFTVTLQRDAPAIYTKDFSGSGAALAFDVNFGTVSTIDGSPVVLYATGLGPTTPEANTNQVGSSTTLAKLQDAMSVFIGGTAADVLFAGLAPALHGVYQINVKPNGPYLDNSISVVMGAYSSAALTLPVPQGLNVTNVTGGIDGLFPATGAVAAIYAGVPYLNTDGFSILLNAATFTTTFDVVPNAAPFSVVAVAGNFRATYNIDPARKTWQATASVVSARARAYDFSGIAPAQVFDFAAGGFPLPGNIMPLSRVDPIVASAINKIPAGTTPGVEPNATYASSGTIPDSGHLTLTGNFGGYINYPKSVSGTTVTVPFGLYVDAKSIASTTATVKFQ